MGNKLLIALALSTGVALLVMVLVVSVGSLLRLQDQTRQQLVSLADVTGQNCLAALTFGEANSAIETLASLRMNSLVRTAAVYDRDGKLFASLPISDGEPGFQPKLAGVARRQAISIRQLAAGRADLERPVLMDQDPVGTVVLVADLAPIWHGWLTDLMLMLAAGAIAYSTALVLALYMRRLIVGPLTVLTGAVSAVAESQDYSKRVEIQSRDEIGRLMSGFNEMLSQIETRDTEIRHLAFYDVLTNLPNRRLLLDRLQHALASCKRHGHEGALLFIDLDNFKDLNDTLGHDKGDQLLRMVATRLVGSVREGDTVARLGGDEFVVILEDLDDSPDEAAAQTKVVGEKILAALNQDYQISSQDIHKTPSIGAVMFGKKRDSADEILRQADMAMYQAKANGRNNLCFFDPVMQATVTARSTLERDLREALKSKQFLLYYQPQVDFASKVTGVEALIRWSHPRIGLVSPGNFIPLAEEAGLIEQLGRWVLDTACAQLADWAPHRDLAHLTMAVNVSARQFRHPDFVEQIMDILRRTRAKPNLLKLELTESLLLDDVEDAIAKMSALTDQGVAFSLDDFGTGYSSLSYLRQLPLHQLKIDKSFVSNVTKDSNNSAIARAIIAMAHSLELSVIAEGVETCDQRDFFAENGCRDFQGYLFGKPIPVVDFEKNMFSGESSLNYSAASGQS